MNENGNDIIAQLAVDVIMRDYADSDLPIDDHDVYLLVRDYRDEFASNDDARLRDAKIEGPLLSMIIDKLITVRDN